MSVVRRNLYNPTDWPQTPATEKGIDVAIAVAMLRMAMTESCDTVVLFSSDTDLLPALEAIRDHTRCHVEVAAWAGANRLRFDGTQLPFCHYLSRSDFEGYSEVAQKCSAMTVEMVLVKVEWASVVVDRLAGLRQVP